MTELWTYIVIMFSLAQFPGDMTMQQTWLHIPGPFESEAECKLAKTKEKNDQKMSQCMLVLYASAIVMLYNSNAYVLEVKPEQKGG